VPAARSSLVLVLHAHLPWVRHPELPFFLEEHWLFEAVAETYLPLLEVFRGIEADAVRSRVAIDISPTLASMLADEMLQDRTERYLGKLLDLLNKEEERTKGDRQLSAVVAFYRERLSRLEAFYVDDLQRDLLGEFARLEGAGVLEVATCAGTHPLLPTLMDRPELVRGQIRTAVREHERFFGRAPRGIWLPECAYAEPLDRYLAEAGLRWFVVDSHGLEHARPRPPRGVYAPAYTDYGVAAFARDMHSSRQVWSAESGYPANVHYREFYRDVGWELPEEYIAPYVDPDGTRMFTGLKYYRITDRSSDHREIYQPQRAKKQAFDDAAHFLASRAEQARELEAAFDDSAVIICPYDAELFGHWWFEGPWFIDHVLRLAASEDLRIDVITPSDVLARRPEQVVVALEPSSWGAGGYFDVWLGPETDWFLPHIVGVGESLVKMLREHAGKSERVDRLLEQAAREVMLAQSSDWPFLISTGTAVEYARRRFIEHIQRFNRLEKMLREDALDESFIALCEERDGLFPEIDLTDFS